MSYAVTFSGTNYTLPDQGDTYSWAPGVKSFFQALAAATLQVGGGTQALQAELDLGGTAGLKALYVRSRAANPSATGVFRLGNTEIIGWKNGANSGDLWLRVGSNDQLNFNGNDITGNPQAVYTTAAGQSFSTGVQSIVNFGTSETDTAAAVTTGASWKFTVPSGKAGRYFIAAAATFSGAIASGTTSLQLFKNGSAVRTLWRSAGAIPSTTMLSGHTLIDLAAADFIDVRLSQASGGSVSLTASALENYISIHRQVT